jgi:hypothetical protein
MWAFDSDVHMAGGRLHNGELLAGPHEADIAFGGSEGDIVSELTDASQHMYEACAPLRLAAAEMLIDPIDKNGIGRGVILQPSIDSHGMTASKAEVGLEPSYNLGSLGFRARKTFRFSQGPEIISIFAGLFLDRFQVSLE